MSQEISSKLVRASEVYSENTALRAVINGIPYIGGSLDVLLSSKGQKIVQDCVIQILDNLKIEMDCIQKSMIDKEYLESEEWFDLIVRGIEAATRTRDKEKIRLYAKVLRGAVTIQDREEFSPEEYLSILTELTPREIEVARVIYEQSQRTPNTDGLQWIREKKLPELSERCPSIPREDLQFILLRLQRSGLIQELVGTYFDYTGGTYIITRVFRKLMHYLGESHS